MRMSVRTKINSGIGAWFALGLPIGFAGLAVGPLFFLLFIPLFIGVWTFLSRVRCAHCQRPVLLRRVRLLGHSFNALVLVPGERCERCGSRF